MQPLNDRVLVRLAESQYKHVSLNTDKQHQNAISEGVVIAVPDGPAPDSAHLIQIMGKKVRWDKFAEQNNTFDHTDPKTGETFKAALIKYEDITAYEPES
jgi:co-chaperonin GroES (HSP10)